jgi:GrpB-like predicted nucleotidyltransferase (UPF0157 family)
VFTAGAAEIGRMLLFRDWLRAHDADRDAYLQVKRDLARRTAAGSRHYTGHAQTAGVLPQAANWPSDARQMSASALMVGDGTRRPGRWP